MKCKNCGEKLDKHATVCPNCGANLTVKVKKPIFKKWWFWVIVVLLVIAIIPSGKSPEKVGGSGAPAVKAETTAPEVYTVGDTLEMKNVRVTLNSVTESTGANFVSPTEGKIFVICEYTIENNTDKDLGVSSMLSFECYADDFTCPLSIGATVSSGKTQLDGTVAAGKKINGVVGYEVDPDYKELELHYNPNLSGDDFVFVYCK